MGRSLAGFRERMGRAIDAAATMVTLSVAALSVGWIGSTGASAQTSDLVFRDKLRVCADPANLPFSARDGSGFENRISELLGAKLQVPVQYVWFPQAMGFIRRTLRANRCDVVMGFAQGHELVQNTNHYYRSAYVLVYRANGPLSGVTTLSDRRLRGRRLGVIAGTPPATAMALNGLMGSAKSFPLMVDRRHANPAGDMVRQIAAGTLDGGILWGPVGGYLARNSDTPFEVVPLVSEANGPRMVYRITMAVRPGERDWKRQLNRLIRRNKTEIERILHAFGVPLLDEENRLIPGAGALQ